VRVAATAVAAVLTVVCASWAVLFALAAMRADGTWLDVVGRVTFTVLATGCSALIPRRRR
jgi:hypothetical protein